MKDFINFLENLKGSRIQATYNATVQENSVCQDEGGYDCYCSECDNGHGGGECDCEGDCGF